MMAGMEIAASASSSGLYPRLIFVTFSVTAIPSLTCSL